jgi:signal transduction histidine kinase/CheY-like chemotaxis protein/CHASE3 domain sensor protein
LYTSLFSFGANIASSAVKILAHVSFWLATTAMVIMGVTLYVAANNEAESARLANHTQEVRQEISEINELTSRAESAQRGYLLSGSAAFLAERDKALLDLSESVANARKLTLENAQQQVRIAQLEKLIARRVEIMREGAKLRAAKGISTSQLRAASGVGLEATANIRELTGELRREEWRLLKLHRTAADNRHETEIRVLIAGVIFGLLVLLPGYLALVFQARSRRQIENTLRVMADNLPGAMYQLSYDARGKPRVTFMSAGWKNVCGMCIIGKPGELPDWATMIDDIDERDRPEFSAALAGALNSFGSFRQSYRVKHVDGTLRCLHHEASLQEQTNGSILQTGYIADITEQRRLEDALLEAKEVAQSANRAKSKFLATMSHEIRTPMNGALGMLELLSLTRLDLAQRNTLGIVRESTESLLRIIDDILDFSMIEAEKLEIRPQVVSIKEVIERVRSIYSGNASSKGVALRRSVDPKISPALMVDPLRLRQILNNFVSNALKFTTEGSIEIKVELIERVEAEDQVQFTVKDTGIGISAENQQHLFKPFSQGDGIEAQRAGGTGLGLTICRRLADMMGGVVRMESELGKGTTMYLTLTLPIADPADLPVIDLKKAYALLSDTTSMRRFAPGVAQAEAEGTLVLVADDHPTNRLLLISQVNALGYAAESADNGVEALDKWKSGRFSIVITDCDMPEMDGYDLARNIRNLEAGSDRKRTPIIACTANALDGEAEVCLAVGMDDCLVKPVDLSQILLKLDHWLPIPKQSAVGCASTTKEAIAPTEYTTIDRSVLAELCRGDAASERRILEDFRRANDTDADTLWRAVAEQDMKQVTRVSHRMLGASRMVGAKRIALVCERIESASRANDWKGVSAGTEIFQCEWLRLNAHFDLS